MKIQLSKHFRYEKYDIDEIELDLANAPANVLARADREMTRRKHMPMLKQMDTMYCGVIASYVSGIPYEVLEALPLPDFNTIVNAVSGFLLNSAEATPDTSLTTEPDPLT